jgi:hypothetical protein
VEAAVIIGLLLLFYDPAHSQAAFEPMKTYGVASPQDKRERFKVELL